MDHVGKIYKNKKEVEIEDYYKRLEIKHELFQHRIRDK